MRSFLQQQLLCYIYKMSQYDQQIINTELL